MTPRIAENVSSSLIDWNLVTIMWATQIPPRNPDDDDAEEEDDGDDEPDDEIEPAVIREPDE